MAMEKRYLSEINQIYKEGNEIYRTAAKTLGLSDCAFWVLYFLRTSEDKLTQSALCAQLYEPKQTVHSALKKLEGEGCIYFQQGNDRRSKYVCLTEKGALLAENTVDQAIQAELSALGKMEGKDKEDFVSLFSQYTELVKQSMAALNPYPPQAEGLLSKNHDKKEGGTCDGC